MRWGGERGGRCEGRWGGERGGDVRGEEGVRGEER